MDTVRTHSFPYADFFLSLQSSDSVIKSTKLKQHRELLQNFRSHREWQHTVNSNTMLLSASLDIPFAVVSPI